MTKLEREDERVDFNEPRELELRITTSTNFDTAVRIQSKVLWHTVQQEAAPQYCTILLIEDHF